MNNSFSGVHTTATSTSPEIGKTCEIPGATINYHDIGSGDPVLLVHGSGPGVSAWANWRGVMPDLSKKFRVIALDMAGFGYTTTVRTPVFDIEIWVQHVADFLDALKLKQVHIVGNSFGGAICLHLAKRHPDRLKKIVLMGAVSLPFAITDGLDTVWDYTPSVDAMNKIMRIFAHDQQLITDDLVKSRFEVSTQRGMDKVYKSLFPAPRQRWVDALAQDAEALAAIRHETLIIHGRDDEVIPLEISIQLLHTLERASLLVFGQCGHWTQIEKRVEFLRAVGSFLAR